MARFEDLVDRLTSAGVQAARYVRPGTLEDPCSHPEFDGLILPDSLVEFWQSHDGMQSDGRTLEQLWIDGIFFYFSHAEAAADYAITLDMHASDPDMAEYWPAGLLPIGTPGDGSRLLLDCRSEQPSYGSVLELLHGMGVTKRSASLAEYFDTIIACLDAGALTVDDHANLEPDFDAVSEIGKRLNPGCSW